MTISRIPGGCLISILWIHTLKKMLVITLCISMLTFTLAFTYSSHLKFLLISIILLQVIYRRVPKSHRIEVLAQYQLINAADTWTTVVIIHHIKTHFLSTPWDLWWVGFPWKQGQQNCKEESTLEESIEIGIVVQFGERTNAPVNSSTEWNELAGRCWCTAIERFIWNGFRGAQTVCVV